MFYVGLDVHTRQSSFCVLDENGKEVLARTVKGPWEKVMRELKQVKSQFKQPIAVCYEASCGYGTLFDLLRNFCLKVQSAHPGKLRLIFASKRKNDRLDAERLAKLLFLDEGPTVHVPSVDVRAWRELIEHRSGLLKSRTAVKNELRAILRSRGVVAPKSLWSRKGVAWLRQQNFESRSAALRRDLLLEKLELMNRSMKIVEKELAAIARNHPGVELLRTIPGVGIRTAEAVVAYVDRPERFGRNKTIGSYFGLVPCQDKSAGVNRLGHITRRGSSTVRRLLTEAAWQGIRHSARIRSFFERVCRRDRQRRKIALIATAHYMIRTMLTMLQTGECWRPEVA